MKVQFYSISWHEAVSSCSFWKVEKAEWKAENLWKEVKFRVCERNVSTTQLMDVSYFDAIRMIRHSMKLLTFPLHVNMKSRGLHLYDHISQETAGNNIWKCRFLDKVSLFGRRAAVVDRNQLKLRVHWVSKATQSKSVERMRQQSWINQQTQHTHLFSMWATLQLLMGSYWPRADISKLYFGCFFQR